MTARQQGLPRTMQLSLDGWCSLRCQNTRPAGPARIDSVFHFLPAMETGDFQDFEIKSRSNRAFKVHKSILKTEKINTDEQYLQSSFFGFSDEVTQTVLHFVYSRCLPSNLSKQTAQQVMDFARNQPNFKGLAKLCEKFLKNTQLQSELVWLVRDMHESLNQTLLFFGGKTFDEKGRVVTGRNLLVGRSLATNPAKLCSVVKQSFANLLLVALRIVQFSEKFVKVKSVLSKSDQLAVFSYAKAQLPLFIQYVRELCKEFCTDINGSSALLSKLFVFVSLSFINSYMQNAGNSVFF